MTKTLYLIRHAQAAATPAGGQDFDKPLSPVGRNECLRLADYVKNNNITPDQLLCSAAKRTTETCHYLFPQHETMHIDYLKELYYTTPSQLLKHIHRTDESIKTLAIISHNPTLHQLSIDLAGAGNRDIYHTLIQHFPPGSFVTLTFENSNSWHDIAQNTATLLDFTTPQQLSEIA